MDRKMSKENSPYSLLLSYIWGILLQGYFEAVIYRCKNDENEL